jgi:hypothetical protein
VLILIALSLLLIFTFLYIAFTFTVGAFFALLALTPAALMFMWERNRHTEA